VHAVNVAGSLGVTPELCEAWARRACMHAMRADFESAARAADEASAVAESIDASDRATDVTSRSAAIAHLYQGVVRTYEGDWQRGKAFAEQAAAEFRDCGDMLELAVAHAVVSENLYYLGELDEALSWAKKGLEIIERSGAQQGILELLAAVVSILARLGEREALEDRLEQLRELTSRTDRLRKAAADALEARYAMAAGECFLITERWDAAAHHLETAVKFVDRYSFIGTRPRFVSAYPLLAQALLKQHQRADSQGSRRRLASKRRVRRLIARSHRWVESFPSLQATTLMAEGMFLRQFGDLAAARRKFDEAARVAEQRGAALVAADCRREARGL
jgi:tetratricopeptide (TPR) repeat protein